MPEVKNCVSYKGKNKEFGIAVELACDLKR